MKIGKALAYPGRLDAFRNSCEIARFLEISSCSLVLDMLLAKMVDLALQLKIVIGGRSNKKLQAASKEQFETISTIIADVENTILSRIVYIERLIVENIQSLECHYIACLQFAQLNSNTSKDLSDANAHLGAAQKQAMYYILN
jgi:hypothetical protein